MYTARFISALQKKSEHYHMLVHVILGILSAYVAMHLFPDASREKLILIGILGNLIPDIDHVFFIFIYGARSEYARVVKSFLRKKQFRRGMHFIKTNHKNNTGIYSHNIISLGLSIYLAWYLGDIKDHAGFYAFFMSWSAHYIYDIVEDLLFFKKLNPNWFMKFNKVKKELTNKA